MKTGDLVRMRYPDGEAGVILSIDSYIDEGGFVRVLWSDGPSLCAISHLIVIEKKANTKKDL